MTAGLRSMGALVVMAAVMIVACSAAASDSDNVSLLSKQSKVAATATATLESSVWLHGEIASLSELEGRQQSNAGALQPDDGRHGLEHSGPRAHYATLWLSNTWQRSKEYCARAAGGTLCSAAQLCKKGAGHAPVGHRELPTLRKTYSPVSDSENSWVLLASDTAAGKADRCSVVKQPAWGSSRKRMSEIDDDLGNVSKSIVACCDAHGIIKSYLRAGAKRPGEDQDEHKPRKHRKHRKRDCTKVGAGYPSAGQKICCPRGMTRYGDGSACRAEGRTSCALWGNYGLKRCKPKRECTVVWADYADAKKGTKLCCPKGMARYGDGSACRAEGRTTCALWSNDSLPRCSDDGRECTKVGAGYPSAGEKICCPKGMRRYGDGSACRADGRTSCALWGNYGLERCRPKRECTVVWSDYADAKKGTKLCCPKGMARYGDGSACRAEGRVTCALWSNDSLPRCSDDGRACTKIGAGYPSAGEKICCPRGMTRYGDGSACRAEGRTSCALWGNYGLDRCRPERECTVVWADYADAKKGTKLCCPKGMARYGDGSACRAEGRTTCALWSNDSLARCSDDGQECTKIGVGYPGAGAKTCCPKGMRRYGDGSACRADGRTSCALWGNYSLKRCSNNPECTVVWAGYPESGDKLCCPAGMARYGDGSACREEGKPNCALWSNDSLRRCGTRRSGGSNRVHLSFDFTSNDFTNSYATFPVRVGDPNDKSNNLLLPYLFGSNAAPERAGTLGLYAHGPLMRTFTAATPVMRVNTAYRVDLLYRPLKGTTQLTVTEIDTGAVVASQTRATSAPLTPAEWNRVTTTNFAVIKGDTRWYFPAGGRQHGSFQGSVRNIKATIAGKTLEIVTK